MQTIQTCTERKAPSCNTTININEVILQHENSAKEWEYVGISKTLAIWIERFNVEFKLQVTTPCLLIDREIVTKLGRYRPGFNGIGTKHQITINSKHLNSPLFDILCTLLHEMLHQWQYTHGIPSRGNFHNKEFREKAMELGIPSDCRGYSLGIVKNSPFKELIRQHGIPTEGIEYYDYSNPKKKKGKTSSRRMMLKRWTCGCQNIYVVNDCLEARCEVCGNLFSLAY